MSIYLTSTAANVIADIATRLDRKPDRYRVAFVPTASDPYEKAPWVEDDKSALLKLGFKLIEMDLKGKNRAEIERTLDHADIIFVAGGNTFYLLEQARSSGFLELTKSKIAGGAIYIGSSAGSVIAGPDIEAVKIFDDPDAADLKDTQALGLVDFVTLPHYGKEKYGSYHDQVLSEYGNRYLIVPIADNQYIIPSEGRYEIVEVFTK